MPKSIYKSISIQILLPLLVVILGFFSFFSLSLAQGNISTDEWIALLESEIDTHQETVTQIDEDISGHQGLLESWFCTGLGGVNSYRTECRRAERAILDLEQEKNRLQIRIVEAGRLIEQARLENPDITPEEVAQIEENINTSRENSRNIQEEALTNLENDPLSAQSQSQGNCTINNLGVCFEIGFAWVVSILLWIFGIILWIASRLFDLSVYVSITTLGDWFNSAPVRNAWRLLRDLANMSFVFILLYIALATVFDFQAVRSGTNKLVVKVIIVALLVNFSGFFVRVVVDASNVIAYEFYTQLGGDTERDTTQSIGVKLMEKLRMDKYFINNDDPNSPQIKTLSVGKVMLQGLGNIFIILVTSFVLLVAAILFTIRTLTLLLLYIFSPIALASYALKDIAPSFSYFTKWKDMLIKQSFFAPAFLIPLFIVFTLMGEDGIGSLLIDNGATLGYGSLMLVMTNILILGMIIGSIFIAQSIGASGAAFATKWGGKTNAAMLRGVGRATRGAAKVTGISKLGTAAATRVRGSALGTGIGKIWDNKVIKDNVRNTAFGKKTGEILKNPILSANDYLGSAAKNVATAAGIKGLSDANFLGSSRDARQAEKEEAKKRKKDAIEHILKTSTDQAEIVRTLRGLPNAEITELPGKDVLTRPDVSNNLSLGALQALNRAGKLTLAEMIKISDNYDAHIRAGHAHPGASFWDPGAIGTVYWR